VYLFYRFTPTLSEKSVYGQLLIRSILVLLFNFEIPLKKVAAKKKGLCVCFLFVSVMVLCDYLCVQAHVSNTV
jgi:hypothetical protein